MNAVVSQTLRCLMSDVSDLTKWTEYLPNVEMVVNSLPNRSTGYSPFFLMYGYHPVLPIELLKGDEITNVEIVAKYLERTQEVWRSAVLIWRRQRWHRSVITIRSTGIFSLQLGIRCC